MPTKIRLVGFSLSWLETFPQQLREGGEWSQSKTITIQIGFDHWWHISWSLFLCLLHRGGKKNASQKRVGFENLFSLLRGDRWLAIDQSSANMKNLSHCCSLLLFVKRHLRFSFLLISSSLGVIIETISWCLLALCPFPFFVLYFPFSPPSCGEKNASQKIVGFENLLPPSSSEDISQSKIVRIGQRATDFKLFFDNWWKKKPYKGLLSLKASSFFSEEITQSKTVRTGSKSYWFLERSCIVTLCTVAPLLSNLIPDRLFSSLEVQERQQRLFWWHIDEKICHS